jgi:hypothetical protein
MVLGAPTEIRIEPSPSIKPANHAKFTSESLFNSIFIDVNIELLLVIVSGFIRIPLF